MSKHVPIIFGIEGTAHTAGLAVIRGKEILYRIEKTYSPEKGGIHPRESSHFLADQFPLLLDHCVENLDISPTSIDAIAFSRGPGLGPCLRMTATFARTLSLKLKKPLIGVNHCIGHVELGKMLTQAKDPIITYVSGGNSQIIAFLNKRYRVLGETLDIALGNALDVLGREIGLAHPGGPKIEKLSSEGRKLVTLPYSMKGMSFSYSGMVTAAKKLLKTEKIEDICYSFQEYAFSIIAEATERAISCTRKKSLLLTGGVGANKRLNIMLSEVAEEQDIEYFQVPRNLAGDNGVMIASAGLKMFNMGEFITIKNSSVIPRWRTDQVDVKWIK